nr:tetratricopeptide repeat protein [Bacteroidota bacterium]
IAYSEKNYETALLDFAALQTNETFGSVVSYYIAQIYYLQGRYETVIMYAPPLLDSADSKLAPQIARIIGESYYRTARYKEAIPYLKRYEKAAGRLSRNDNYEIGYAYYKINEFDDAITYFVNISNIDDDSLMQNAYYHLGDCYLKMGNKQFARNSFGAAYKLNFDKAIQEDALFNYAKLCYELAFNPYNEAIRAFQKYIKDYPNSARIDEVQLYLVNVFITTKNYREALEELEKIKVLTPELQQTHQKVAYYRGIELFNNMEYTEAIKSFDKSMTYMSDKNIRAAAIYWKAESYYRNKQYQKAIDNFEDYIAEPGAINKDALSDANYNIGYAYNKLGDYTNSIWWFRKFVTFVPKAEEKKINDAYNRIGDGYFMNRDFASAAEYYDLSYKMKLINADYALFQKALAKGVLKKYTDKISDLKLFITTYSSTSSTYIQRAKFELAMTYLVDNQNDPALTGFKKFVEEYPNSIYVNTALSKIGLIYYNKKEDDNALYYFDKLVKRDRKSQEANEAIATITNIYKAKGNVDNLEIYLKSIGATIAQATLDSIAYGIGKNHYMEQDCKNVVTDFERYIQKFPDGIFILQAIFYKAECEYKTGNTDAALIGYSKVISKNRNEFTEQSLYRASDILFKKQNYTQALDYYKMLDTVAENPKNRNAAKIGLMQCNFRVKNYPDAIAYSNNVLSIEKVGTELINEAHYTIASSRFATVQNERMQLTDLSKFDVSKYDAALAEFQAVTNSAKNKLGAESGYYVAYIHYLKGNYKQAEKSIFNLINGDGDYPYWTTKALILLADNYVALKDNFQAKTTLKSVITDSDLPELIKIAQEKLDKITAEEEAAKQPKTTLDPIQLPFSGDSTEQKKLFNEPVIPTPEGEPKHD